MTWLDENRDWLARAAERCRPRSSEPLRLRVWLRSPLVWDAWNGVGIDGALQHAIVLRETGRLADDVFADAPRSVFADIAVPLADVERAGRRIACASWAQPPVCAVESLRYWRKRARAELMPIPGGKGVLVTGGGAYKSLQIPVPTLATPYVDFFVVGDRSLLSDLLRDVGAIGRGRAGGLGSVLGTEITSESEDRSLRWRGRPMRATPVADEHEAALHFEHGAYELREAATRAPYWHMSTRALCAMPIVRLGQEAA